MELKSIKETILEIAQNGNDALAGKILTEVTIYFLNTIKPNDMGLESVISIIGAMNAVFPKESQLNIQSMGKNPHTVNGIESGRQYTYIPERIRAIRKKIKLLNQRIDTEDLENREEKNLNFEIEDLKNEFDDLFPKKNPNL